MGFSGSKRELPVQNADFLNDFFLIILPHPALDPLTAKTIETIFPMFANKIHFLRGEGHFNVYLTKERNCEIFSLMITPKLVALDLDRIDPL